MFSCDYSAPGRGAEYCGQPVCLCVCLSVSISLELLDRSARNFMCRSPLAVARSSSGGVALCYALAILWMTTRLAVMGATSKGGGGTERRRSITCATGAEPLAFLFVEKIIIYKYFTLLVILQRRKRRGTMLKIVN